MKTTVNFDLTDYMAIARLVNDSTTDRPSSFEVEYTADCLYKAWQNFKLVAAMRTRIVRFYP